MKTIKWGVLGTGRIARRLLQALQKAENAEAVMIGGRDAEKARALAAEFNIARAGSFEEVLQDEAVRVVYNATPNGLHGEWTIRAANAGKNVLCEKPLALSAREVAAMFEAARSNEVLLMEAFMYRFHPQWRRVQEILNEGRIGQVRFVRAIFAFGSDNFDDVRFSRELQGGALADVGCYCVNFCRLAARLNNSESFPVAAFAHANFHNNDSESVDETMSGVLRFSDGVLGQFFCGLRAEAGGGAEIVGERGKIEITDPWFGGPMGKLVIHADGKSQTLECEMLESQTLAFSGADNADNYVAQVEYFSRAVENRSENDQSLDGLFLPPADALGNAAVLEACLISAREGREAPIP